MAAETLKFYAEQTGTDQQKQIIDSQMERARRLAEPETPVQTLGNLALTYIFSGSLAHGAVLPRTEVITVEGIVATTEAGDRMRQAA